MPLSIYSKVSQQENWNWRSSTIETINYTIKARYNTHRKWCTKQIQTHEHSWYICQQSYKRFQIHFWKRRNKNCQPTVFSSVKNPSKTYKCVTELTLFFSHTSEPIKQQSKQIYLSGKWKNEKKKNNTSLEMYCLSSMFNSDSTFNHKTKISHFSNRLLSQNKVFELSIRSTSNISYWCGFQEI